LLSRVYRYGITTLLFAKIAVTEITEPLAGSARDPAALSVLTVMVAVVGLADTEADGAFWHSTAVIPERPDAGDCIPAVIEIAEL
jgi:uncharacterized membrane protein